MTTVNVRISKEIYEKVSQVAEKSGKSIREVVEDAIMAYVMGAVGDKPIKAVKAKIIPVNWGGKCAFCGRRIEPGELAYWAKTEYEDGSTRSSLICLDCYYKDSAMAEWYLKKKKWEAIVRGLEKRAEQLRKEIEALEVQKNLAALKSEVFRMWQSFKDAITDNKLLEEIDGFMDNTITLIEKLIDLEVQIQALEIQHSRKEVRKVVQRRIA
jgi:hypothetical protein